jgi:hypothetical protein
MTLMRILTLALACNIVFAEDLSDDLLAATRKGDLAAVKALLDRGVSVNSKSPYGSTPLFFACDRGHVEIVKLLIDRGADVNVEDTFYHATALTWALQKNRPEIVKLLLDHGAKSAADVLETGARSGNTQLMKIALEAKGGVDKVALSTALVAATKAKKAEAIEMLTAAGAVMPEPPKIVKLEDAVLQRYTGVYNGGRGGTEFEFTFAVKDGQLTGSLAGQPPWKLDATDATHFFNDQLGFKIEFVVEGGAATGFNFAQGSSTLIFKRKVVSK